jgi:hypothetical protein
MAPDAQNDPEQAIERDAENLEQDLDRLGDHIDEAKGRLAERAKEAGNTDAVAGDWEDTEPDDVIGDDPKGAAGGEGDDGD